MGERETCSPPGDCFIVEDMRPWWERYSPWLLRESYAAFRDALTMDMAYANSCPQLTRGVFRRSVVEQQRADLTDTRSSPTIGPLRSRNALWGQSPATSMSSRPAAPSLTTLKPQLALA